MCRELINGELYCEVQDDYRYIPNYCYKDSTLAQYIGDKSWEYQKMNIKHYELSILLPGFTISFVGDPPQNYPVARPSRCTDGLSLEIEEMMKPIQEPS